MSAIGLEEMETPRLVIDMERMARNIDAMAELARARGVKLRPHAKTHKLPSVAHAQLEAGAAGITVAKVSEAEVMAAHGIPDIFIAYPLVTESKLARALRLAERIDLTVGADSLAGARLADASAARHGWPLKVRLEIDTGLSRTGVPYAQAEELAAEIARLPHLRLTGIYTFRGALLDGKPTRDLAAAGAQEGTLMARLAERLRAQGIPVADVSVGSTPTAAHAAAVPGVTEIRPGTYVYQDRMQAGFGVCGMADCAGSVLVTVVSLPAPDLAIVDGGSKTFATDVQPGTAPLHLQGFGQVVGYEDAWLARMTEEHGMVQLGPVAQAAGLRVGDRLRIVPNHICSTVNLHNQVWMQRGDRYEAHPILARGLLE
ncbi:alanine racemase [Cohnella nanjingensis]|uniref:Alanine racemase n=1 Tax=Cohnella nanjingensis TaxID=1387779 RepID=A0A7X0RYZ8_9BACL|nr:alanine racemase [Cohnella nanjingensis]MBB6674910.1 alanine racemase [Cohnella nanjingensis]